MSIIKGSCTVDIISIPNLASACFFKIPYCYTLTSKLVISCKPSPPSPCMASYVYLSDAMIKWRHEGDSVTVGDLFNP